MNVAKTFPERGIDTCQMCQKEFLALKVQKEISLPESQIIGNFDQLLAAHWQVIKKSIKELKKKTNYLERRYF